MSKRSLDSNDGPDPKKVAKSSSKSNNSSNDLLTSVLLRSNGKYEEISISLSDAESVLGGPWSFFGRWDEINAILIVRSDQHSESITINQNKFQPPYHKLSMKGDILLIKTDDSGNRLDFTLAEYEEFMKLEIKPWELEVNNGDDDDDDDDNDKDEEENDQEDKGEEEEDDDDEYDEKFYDSIVVNVINDCQNDLGREINESERLLISALIDNISLQLRGLDPDDDNADIGDIGKDIKIKLIPWFRSTYSRSPSIDENAIISKTVDRVIVSAAESVDEDDEDDEDDANAEVDKAQFIESISIQLINDFTTTHNRSPTEEEEVEMHRQAEYLVNNGLDADENNEAEDDEEDPDQNRHQENDDQEEEEEEEENDYDENDGENDDDQEEGEEEN